VRVECGPLALRAAIATGKRTDKLPAVRQTGNFSLSGSVSHIDQSPAEGSEAGEPPRSASASSIFLWPRHAPQGQLPSRGFFVEACDAQPFCLFRSEPESKSAGRSVEWLICAK